MGKEPQETVALQSSPDAQDEISLILLNDSVPETSDTDDKEELRQLKSVANDEKIREGNPENEEEEDEDDRALSSSLVNKVGEYKCDDGDDDEDAEVTCSVKEPEMPKEVKDNEEYGRNDDPAIESTSLGRNRKLRLLHG